MRQHYLKFELNKAKLANERNLSGGLLRNKNVWVHPRDKKGRIKGDVDRITDVTSWRITSVQNNL